MPFSWYEAAEAAAIDNQGRARVMYERELAERAALLMSLGFTKKAVLARLKANVGWDFELNGTPPHAKRVGAIVDGVFARRGVGAGTPTL